MLANITLILFLAAIAFAAFFFVSGLYLFLLSIL